MNTRLRISYSRCVHHIQKNLRKNLKIDIITDEFPDVIHTVTLDHIRNMTIAHMEEIPCEDDRDCLNGKMFYNDNVYKFITHHRSYDVILLMEKMSYPYNKMKIVLPITSHKNEHLPIDSKIYIPPEYMTDDNIIPIEFIWEFLSQLPSYIDQSNYVM